MIKNIMASFLLVLIAFSAQAAKIKATVQDEIITDLDVLDRLNVLSEMSNIELDDRTKADVLEDLIDEKIKLLTAEKNGIQISEEQVADGISLLEQRNQMQSGDLQKFITDKNLSMNSVKSQVKADLAWMHYMQSQNLKRPDISDKEVNAEKEKIKKQLMQPMYLLAEIYIPFDGNEAAAEQEINTLFNRITAGESFTDLAKEYSKGKTAEKMGDLGWVKPKEMEKAVDEVLPYMQSGQLSKPIKGKAGFYLILMRDNQPALDSDMQEVIQVTQAILNQADTNRLKSELEKASTSCMAFTQFATTHGVKGSNSGALPEMMSVRMPSEFKMLLKDKKVGELVGPVSMPPYDLFVMKCASKVMSILPADEVIRENLQIREIEKQAADLLQKERQKMLVDIK